MRSVWKIIIVKLCWCIGFLITQNYRNWWSTLYTKSMENLTFVLQWLIIIFNGWYIYRANSWFLDIYTEHGGAWCQEIATFLFPYKNVSIAWLANCVFSNVGSLGSNFDLVEWIELIRVKGKWLAEEGTLKRVLSYYWAIVLYLEDLEAKLTEINRRVTLARLLTIKFTVLGSFDWQNVYIFIR